MNAVLSGRAALQAIKCWAKLKGVPGAAGRVIPVDSVCMAWLLVFMVYRSNRRGCLQLRQHVGAGLHGAAAVVEVQGAQTAEFFAAARAARSAMQ